jgi:hypothetical protein
VLDGDDACAPRASGGFRTHAEAEAVPDCEACSRSAAGFAPPALGQEGDFNAARAAVTKASERTRAYAGKIDDPAYRRRYLEDVPENRNTLALAREWLAEGREIVT